MSTPTRSPQAPHPSQPTSRSPRHAALLSILAMSIAILLCNIAVLVLTTLPTKATRLGTTPISTSKCPKCGSSTLTNKDQDWFRLMPLATQLCWEANLILAMASSVTLMRAFISWMVNISLISVVVRNYALAYGIGAGILGVVLMHITLLPTLIKGDGILRAINSILGLFLAGLVFGTIE